MATTEDLEAGWELYRNSGFSLSLDEINERLVRMGFTPVSDRAYEHYRRLARRGFRRYITINRLDTMNVPDPFRDESIRSRYAYERSNVPTQLVIAIGASPVEVLGRADALSDFGTEVVVEDREQREALRALSPPAGTPVTVNFLSPSYTAYGKLDFVSTLDPEQARIGIVFRALTPIYEITGGTALPTQSFSFVIGLNEEAQPLDLISQDVYWLLQAVESARGVVNVVLQGMTQDVLSPPPSVEKLTVASPMEATLRISVEVYLLLDRMREIIKNWSGVPGSVTGALGRRPLVTAQAEAARAQGGLLEAQAEHFKALTQGVRIDNERRQVLADLTGALSAYLIQDLEAAGLTPNHQPAVNIERLTMLVFKELEPSLRELSERGLSLERGALPTSDDSDAA